MNKLLDYAYLSINKEKRDFAIADYARLKPNREFYSHSQAIKRLYKIKHNLGALIKRLPNNLMIAGSTALACVYKDTEIIPHDLDIYMSDNDHKTVTQIDSAIRATYHTEIIIMRTQYTINWFLKDPENKGYPIIQLVLPPVRHWSEVFSSSHCDLVCIGFLVGEKKFVYGKGRWDRFYNEGFSYGTVSFTDEEYQKRVYDAIKKYQDYGFKIKPVASNGVLVRNQIENSPRFDVDVVVFEDVEEFIMKHPQVTVGKYLHNIYSGEIFKDYIETMSIFNRCPICSDLIIEKKVCNICQDKENNRLEFIRKMIKKSDKDLRYLVTGGRCGLGNQISKILMNCGRDVTVTTRFPKLAEGKKTIQLDMKDPKSVEEFEKEVGNFDVLILSAAETLHYSDNNLPNNPDIKNELDWTNDFHREDTGIWHKCIDEHTDEEIEDPIHINIISITKIIRAFVAHQVKNESSNQKTIIYVTSAEGAFVNKSPFHPVTNMTKSAIEQLICTLKRQADILGMNIVMVDPGWMYTKSTNGKNVGPIKLEWGAAQVLSPLADIFKGLEVENASLWKRKKGCNAENLDQLKELKFKGEGETCPATFDDSNVMIKFYPCQHKLGLPAWYHMKNNENTTRCPLCRGQIENTEIVSMIAGEEGQYEYNSESDNEAETGNSDEGKENSKSDSGYGTEKSYLREEKDWSSNDDGWIEVRK